MTDFEVHPVGTSERLRAAEGHMPFPGHRSHAEVQARGPEGARTETPAVMAVYRPRARTVVVFVAGGDPEGVELDVREARAVHSALGQALKLADSAHDPVSAVSGLRSSGPANRGDL